MTEKKYIDRPNLLRVAQELAKFEAPLKAADALMRAVEGGAKDGANAK